MSKAILRHDLVAAATGRKESLFATDMRAVAPQIRDAIRNARVLVVGGAGSIGSGVVRRLAAEQPKALHVMDVAENDLVEVVRDLRNQGVDIADFRTFALDYGSPIAARYLAAEGPFDLVFNLAAMKHVRAERDPFTLLRMIETNVVKCSRFLDSLDKAGRPERFFSVSTDKAANAASLMGATKRLMEHVIFSEPQDGGMACTSARFANVAFSAGSLLESFLYRLDKGQPLAAPEDTYRFFISIEEAAELCILAGVALDNRLTAIPRRSPALAPIRLQDIAAAVLEAMGREPLFTRDEAEARSLASKAAANGARYPVLLTPLDTSGEKDIEEFVGDDEALAPTPFAEIEAVAYRPCAPERLARFLEDMTRLAASRETFDKQSLVAAMADVLPELRHRETGRNLDQRI